MRFLVLLSFFTFLNTCNHQNKSAIIEDKKEALYIDGTYHVKTLNGNHLEKNNLTITFNQKDQIISGFSGCNRFRGGYVLKANSIKIGPLASTRMFCQEMQQVESEMQEALSKASEIIIENDLLKLLNGDKIILTAFKEQDNQSSISFNYSATSRGRFLDIHVNDSLISVSKDRKANPVSKAITSENWKQLNSLLETINLDSISNLKAPTEARFYDGASIGQLEVTKNGTVYESSSFDHGKPPSEIEALVKEILSISENVE
ncbi:META domain-containing protein [Confluentibacter sediminis]|uniref:META domain-containing protein n=1 Tax=Confluentibacter sediminis TaxID=2219045 RepID=UPI000DAEC526|nr:META domain-containing protein [Confluentibacter sediminis]